MTFFGEELGLVGSRYYGAHPIFPLAKTVADLNLEQVGRTDVDGGSSVGLVNVTGYDFSTLTDAVRKAGEATGLQVVKNEQLNVRYFAQSDNQALADAGVPAHTLSVGYVFPGLPQARRRMAEAGLRQPRQGGPHRGAGRLPGGQQPRDAAMEQGYPRHRALHQSAPGEGSIARPAVYIHVALEVVRAMKPRAGANEAVPVEPFRTVVASGSTGVGSRVIVTIGTVGGHSGVDAGLSLCFGSASYEADAGNGS
jgi:hypothetical protein